MPPPDFKVVIVQPPGFAHSKAFRELAETLHCGLRALGHASQIVENGFDPQATNLVLGWHLLSSSVAGMLPDRCIIYNLEQLDERNHHLRQALFAFSKRFEIWDYSARNIQLFHGAGFEVPIRHVPIGYVPQLSRIKPARTQDIDVLFYGALNARRMHVLEALSNTGRKVCCVTAPPDATTPRSAFPSWVTSCSVYGVYGAQRDALIARAKVVLNLHYYESQIFEMVRVSYLLANRKAVVAECNPDTEVDADLRGAGLLVPYAELVPACLRLLEDGPARKALLEEGFKCMSARDEAAILREALAGWRERQGQAAASGAPSPPLVSVVVITRNRPVFLRRALESLQAQAFRDFEVVLVNDGGVDISGVVADFTRGGLTIDLQTLPEGRGQSAARNKALLRARGRWIAYLDDDDLYYPDHLQVLVDTLRKTGAKVAYTDSMRAIEEERNGEWVVLSRELAMSNDFDREHFLRDNLTPINNVMHERACWEVCGPHDETLPVLEDWDYWIRLSRRWDFVHVAKATAEVRWRASGANITFQKQDLFPECRRRIARKIEAILERENRQQPQVRLVDPFPVRIVREAFLFEPDWEKPDWVEILLAYLQAFSPGETVALVFILDAARISMERAQAQVLGIIRRLGRETFPDVILEDKREQLLHLLRDFQHVQWLGTRGEALAGVSGRRFTEARLALVPDRSGPAAGPWGR